MFLDFGMSELLLIGVVALVFIGPKDLPKALRVAGYWMRKARTMSREFQSSVEQMIREAELDEVRQELKKATEIDIDKEFRRTIDPTGSLAESLKSPELPKFSDAEPPATGSGTHADPTPGGPKPGTVVPTYGGVLPGGDRIATPAPDEVQDSSQGAAAAGIPLTRE